MGGTNHQIRQDLLVLVLVVRELVLMPLAKNVRQQTPFPHQPSSFI